MVAVPFPPFEPDKNRFNPGAVPETINVLPVADGWAPQPGMVELTPAFEYLVDENGAILQDELPGDLGTGPDGSPLTGYVQLPSTCLGSIYVRTPGGTTRAFFGTETALFEFDFTDLVFVDISGGSAPYAVPVNNRWSFQQFGTRVYVQNGADPEQYIEIDGGVVFADNATAPIASYLATVGDFLVRGRLVSDASTLQWSALNDPTSNVVRQDGSDEQVLAVGNGITGIVPTTFGAVVLCRDAIYAMNFALQTQFVFTFSVITEYRGAVAPYAVCSIGQNDFGFYGADGFFRGIDMQPVGAERIDRWFLAQTNESGRTAMTAAPDYRRKIVWFRYLNIAEEYRLLGYNWQLDRWCQSDADLQDMLRAESANLTIDGLDNLYDTIDDIDIPFDSSAFDGGSREFAGITDEGFFAYMNGSALQATLTTNEVSLNGINRAHINRGTLNTDATTFTVTPSTTNYQGDTFRERSPVSPSSRSKQLAFRADGRTHKFKTVIPAGEDWSIITALDVTASATGNL